MMVTVLQSGGDQVIAGTVLQSLRRVTAGTVLQFRVRGTDKTVPCSPSDGKQILEDHA